TSSSTTRMTLAIWARVCSQAGEEALAIAIELLPCRKLALDLTAPLLASVGALVGLAPAEDDGGHLSGAGHQASCAHSWVHAKDGGGLGALAHGVGRRPGVLEHRHQLVLDLDNGAREVEDGPDQEAEQGDTDQRSENEHNVEHDRPPTQEANEKKEGPHNND